MLLAYQHLSIQQQLPHWLRSSVWVILLSFVVLMSLGNAAAESKRTYPFFGYGQIPLEGKKTLKHQEPRPWWDNQTIGNAYERERLVEIHVNAAEKSVPDTVCLGCHQEIFEAEGAVIPAIDPSIDLNKLRPWYQEINTYQGSQLRFHERHLKTPLTTSIMAMSCVFCHENTEVRVTFPGEDSGGSFRKQVNGETNCLRCHGQFPAVHGKGWAALQEAVGGQTCLACHTEEGLRIGHEVHYLQAEAIVAKGRDNAELCYGCHGYRSWYQKALNYKALKIKRHAAERSERPAGWQSR
ncbi:MAG: hypothetical protein OEU26_21830 [Candidatus Tectomicrobia bacterium]|nr:hypothetical protein [Candidatus Tectomicrobia bacterium]